MWLGLVEAKKVVPKCSNNTSILTVGEVIVVHRLECLKLSLFPCRSGHDRIGKRKKYSKRWSI